MEELQAWSDDQPDVDADDAPTDAARTANDGSYDQADYSLNHDVPTGQFDLHVAYWLNAI